MLCMKEELIELEIFGRITNTSEEDWENITLSLVANELEIKGQVYTNYSKKNVHHKEDVLHRRGNEYQIFVKTLTGKTITLARRL